jgi:hypothetical protein
MVEGKLTNTGISKIKYAVKGGIDGKDTGPSNGDLVALTEGKKNPIRPKSMGWGRTEYDRLTFLIQLEHDISAGISLTKSTPIYNRVCVSTAAEQRTRGIGGEWLTRTYLRQAEVENFIEMERRPTLGLDVVLGGIRGLPRVTEIDNFLLRSVKRHYEEVYGIEVCVHIMTLQHALHWNNTAYFDHLSDEPIMVVTYLKSKNGGSDFRRSWKENRRSMEIMVGTIRLRIFMELKDVQGEVHTPLTGRIVDIDARRIDGLEDWDMGRIFKELTSVNDRLVGIIKADDRWKKRWYGIMKKEGANTTYNWGNMTIKERNIPRLANRPESMRVGMDGKQSNANAHLERSDKQNARGQTYPQQVAYKGGGIERGRSRSRSKSRETSINVSDLKDLRENHAQLKEANGGAMEDAKGILEERTRLVQKYGNLNRTGKTGADQGGKEKNKSI